MVEYVIKESCIVPTWLGMDMIFRNKVNISNIYPEICIFDATVAQLGGALPW